MKRSIIAIAVLALTFGSAVVLAGGGKNKDTTATDTTTTCTYDVAVVVAPVTADQNTIIESGYCGGQTAAELAVMFMTSGLTEADIQAQIDAATAQ